MMNFGWAQKYNTINIREQYRMLTEEFCKQFYGTFDSNYPLLAHYFMNDVHITYFDEELNDFNKLSQKWASENIQKFNHQSLQINAQPIDEKSLIINIVGTLTINLSNISNQSIETIILKYDDSNKLCICNYTFKII